MNVGQQKSHFQSIGGENILQVQQECVVTGLVPVLANLLMSSDSDTVVVTHSATILTKLARARGFVDEVQKHDR